MTEFYNEMLIKNIDCSLLYLQIKDDELIKEYEDLKKKKKILIEKDETDHDEFVALDKRIEELNKEIFSFKKPIEFPDKDNIFYYSGTLSDSLLGRKLREVAKDRGEYEKVIRKSNGVDYTDLIINLKFKKDIMIPDGMKKAYIPETKKIEETGSKKMKKLISKNKLRKMAYRDGITINGVRYVNYQRTSSKARIGNDLFIREDYFDAMNEWQNLNIPFSELEKADIVSIRSYQSLIASSIMGTLDIDPYSILLIDDVSGQATMDCNVVKPFPSSDGKGTELKVVREPYTQKTDLWDGQSLLDFSAFKHGKYVTKDKDGNIVENSYEPYGFMLLRNHFFKSAAFSTNLQEYYKERFKDVENPVLTDMFGNEFKPEEIKMVTTPNSVKIFKFSDIICGYMIEDGKKEYLNALQELLNEKYEEIRKAKQAVTTAKRKLTMLLNYDPNKGKEPPTQDDIDMAMEDLIETEIYYDSISPGFVNSSKTLLRHIRLEQKRLTWDWYREQIKNQSFGVCKTEHKSKFGDKQQLWYQIFVSLNFNENELWELVKPQVEEINLMRKYVAWFKRGLDMRANDNVGDSMMLALLDKNDDISRTKWYTSFRHSKIQRLIKKLLAGKIQVKGSDFCILFGNPYEMLRASCGDKIETSILSDFKCYCNRYADGEDLYGMRSPHICTGNNALLRNTYRDEWKWFNLTQNILIINLWDKGAFLSPVWNGMDTDSDSAFIGNNPIILEKVKRVQDYLIPINCVPQESKYNVFTNENMAKIDNQLCNDMIGKICNLARDLSSLYWHLYNTGTEDNKEKYLPMIYDDICLLEVLSNIAIDSAKRRYDCNIEAEMKKIKARLYMTSQGAIIKDDKIIFTETRYKKSLSEKSIADYEECINERENATSQEEIAEINKKIEKILKTEDVYMVRPDFTKNLKSQPKKKKRKKFKNEEEKELYRQKQIAYKQEQDALKEKIYKRLVSPMDLLKEVIYDPEHLKRSPRTNYIDRFTDILATIPKGIKADYNRIEKIKEVCIEAKKRMDCKQSEYDSGKISFDEMWEEKKNIQKDVIANLKDRKVTSLEINKLIRDVYDEHPELNKHGRVIRLKNGKPKMIDARDKNLIKNEAGGWMLQWLYSAHKDEFLKTVKNSKGDVSYVRRYNDRRKNKNSETEKIIDTVTWDGTQYEVVTRKA
ncbi:hypothetical protein AALC75_20985 [Lachnospiraceae bacterium 48-42]